MDVIFVTLGVEINVYHDQGEMQKCSFPYLGSIIHKKVRLESSRMPCGSRVPCGHRVVIKGNF